MAVRGNMGIFDTAITKTGRANEWYQAGQATKSVVFIPNNAMIAGSALTWGIIIVGMAWLLKGNKGKRR